MSEFKKYDKDVAETIDFLKDQVIDFEKQINIIENIDFNSPVNEDTWHMICNTPLRTSELMGKLLKNTFPDAENIEVGCNYVYFTLYGFQCYIPTSEDYCIEINTNWYIQDKGLDDFYKYCCRKRINAIKQKEEYFEIENPSFKQKLEYVYDTPEYHMPLFKKLFLSFAYHKIYKIATDRNKIKSDCDEAHQMYSEYVKRYYEDRKIMKAKVIEMEQLISEFSSFTKNIKPHGHQISPQDIINTESN